MKTALAAAALLAAPAFASDDDVEVWTSARVDLVVVPTDLFAAEDVRDAVERAAAQWNDVDGAPRIAVAAVDDAPAEMDGVNALRFQRQEWTYDAAAGAATYRYATDYGVVVETDVLVNAVERPWCLDGAADAYDLENALAHELGHVLGLPDVDDDEATMHWRLHPGETKKRDLSPADVDALQAHYEGVELRDPVAEGAGCGGGSAAAGALLVPLLRLRRRR